MQLRHQLGVAKEERKHLKQKLARVERELLEREREERLCSICQGRVPYQRLNCGHVLCRGCIDDLRRQGPVITSVGPVCIP